MPLTRLDDKMDKTNITFAKEDIPDYPDSPGRKTDIFPYTELPANKDVLDVRLQQMSSIMTMQTPRYDKVNSLISQSVDVPSMKGYLDSQCNRFNDLLKFGDKDQPAKVPASRVRNNQ